MAKRVWEDLITDQDKSVYEFLGLGTKRVGFGTRPALVIIDVQYRTVGDEPAPIMESVKHYRTSCGQAGWDAMDKIAELLEVARAKGVPIVYPYVSPKKAADAGRLGEKVPAIMKIKQRGYDFVEAVAPREGDIAVPKKHASAFFGTPLMSYLNDLDIDTLIVCGCTTSGCVRATVTDGFSYNFRVVVVEECVYDRAEVSHAINLWDMNSKYADVVSSQEVEKYLSGLESRA
jgi:nicotinamidase-related amidase